MSKQQIVAVNGTGKDAPDPAPPYTEALTQSLEQWHAVHAQNRALLGENERLKADNFVLQSRADWLEQECQRLTIVSDRYKASNVEVATAARCAAGIFNDMIQRVLDAEHAPQQTLVPIALQGGMTAEEAEDSIKKIAERFGSGRPKADEQATG